MESMSKIPKYTQVYPGIPRLPKYTQVYPLDIIQVTQVYPLIIPNVGKKFETC